MAGGQAHLEGVGTTGETQPLSQTPLKTKRDEESPFPPLPPSGLLPEPLTGLEACRGQSPAVQSREDKDQMGGHRAQDQHRYGMGEDNWGLT